MKNIRACVYVILAGYIIFSLVAPKTIYIDRYLLNMSYVKWVPLQIFPSMYTTEISILNERTGKKFSLPHHPARMLFHTKNQNRCEKFDISVRYQKYSDSRRFSVCHGRLDFLDKEKSNDPK